MQHCIEWLSLFLCFGEHPLDQGTVLELSLHERNFRREEISPAVAQVVKDNRFMTAFSKQTRYRATNVPRTASNQDLHKNSYLSCSFLGYS